MKISMMKMKALLIVAIVVASNVAVVQGDCTVGDILYQTGQSVGYFKYACINGTHFEGSESFCAEDGNLVDQDVVLQCPESVQSCVQCGTPEMGEALCLSTAEVPDNCDASWVGPPRPEPVDCLSGDILYRPGDSVGYIGYSCINETHFEGSESFCGADGNFMDQAVVLQCPESVPSCVQCGTPETGSALCLSTTEVPDYCDDSYVGPPRPETESVTADDESPAAASPPPPPAEEDVAAPADEEPSAETQEPGDSQSTSSASMDHGLMMWSVAAALFSWVVVGL